MGGVLEKFKKDFKKNNMLYLMFLPVFAYYVIFHYWPMYGVQIAFRDYTPGLGILGSPWVGFDHFITFFKSHQFVRLIKNTFILNVYGLLFSFPAPILLALLLNEIRNKYYKKIVQTVSYLPHFISMVVICGIIVDFVRHSGFITDIVVFLGGERVALLTRKENFRIIYIASGIWQEAGWGSIVYFAAISSIDPELYQAALIDGAGRFKQAVHVTLPGIASTIIILFILRIGRMMSVGFEKVILLYNPAIYETADVISTYVYRKGLVEMKYSFSSAVGLFNSVINFSLLVTANYVVRRYSETSLW